VDADVLQRIAVAVAMPAKRNERAQTAADLIRDGTAHRWVGIYTVTDSSVVNEAWSGPVAPAFPTFPRERGLTAHALRARAPALSNDVANDPRYLTNQDDSGSELILPVVRGRQVVGTLDVESDEVGAFDGASIRDLECCALALAALWNEVGQEGRQQFRSHEN
jgi:putative methionine-R-sulfoxide reductase with GAF domain